MKKSLTITLGLGLVLSMALFVRDLKGQAIDRWGEQTPVRDQQDRNTCVVHACLAALEAFYGRQGVPNLNLSEQYLHHIWKSTWFDTSPGKNYENQSCYWGGGSIKDIVAILENYRIPEEGFCPYENDNPQMRNLIGRLNLPFNPNGQPPGRFVWSDPNPFTQEQLDRFEYDPGHVDVRAYKNAKYGAKKVVYLDKNAVRKTDKLEDLINRGHEVAILFDRQIWREQHAVLLVGYDNKNQWFIFKNSNGNNLNNLRPQSANNQPQDQTILTYQQVTRSALEGLYVESVLDPREDSRATFLGRWNMTHDGHRGKVVIRRIGTYNQADRDPHNFALSTRLGSYYDGDGKAFAVNGQIDGNKMEFWIDFGTTRQKFTVYVYGQGRSGGHKMAGFTDWQGTPFGVFASREELPPQQKISGPVQPKEIQGLWMMEHDGWEGFLSIQSVKNSSLEGIYTSTKENKKYPVNGQIKDHRLMFEISFPGNSQKFEGYVLSGDRNIIAGFTWWQNTPFGFQAQRRGPVQ